jgi:peptidoglycan/LPS O-acetylase OafA/YrhL
MLVPHGYLAVDFFFILSGFVLAKAYTGRLDTLTLLEFAQIRVKRFLPLSVLGVVLGTAYLLIRWYIHPQKSDDLADIIAAFGLNLVLIPKLWIATATQDQLFAANGVLWSLSLEMVVNLIWAAFLFRSKSATILMIVLVAAAATAVAVYGHGGADLGWGRSTYIGGLARAAFGFFLGVLLWRYRPSIRTSSLMSFLSFAALVGVLCQPFVGWALDVFSILVAFPIILYVAAGAGMVQQAAIFNVLGNLSYPLYATHLPILMLITESLRKSLDYPIGYSIYLLTMPIIAGSILLDKYYDIPIRRWLDRIPKPGVSKPVRPVLASALPECPDSGSEV